MLKTLLLGAAFALAALPAFAQGNSVPPQLLGTTRPLKGDTIRFCIDTQSPGAAFDRDVAQAVADAMLVNAVFVEAPSGFPLDAGGYFDELRLTMSQTCEVLPGISLQPEMAIPEWASVTRAYAEVPFVLVVTDPSWQRLGDIPQDRKIGTAIGSVGERAFITYMSALREDQRWARLPYADPVLMLKRLRDGSLGGMVLWQPVLNLVAPPDTQGDLRIIATDPVPASSALIGMLVSGRDTFLRTALDEAIAALIADGQITALMEAHGYAGTLPQ